MDSTYNSPDDINKIHGKPVWKCFGCRAESGLHWHNGWSVAMCRKPECASSYTELITQQQEQQDIMDAIYREHYE